MNGGFAYRSPYTLVPGQPSPGAGYLPASLRSLPTNELGRRVTTFTPKGSGSFRAQHHQIRYGLAFAGTGISTRCPSTTPVGLALGPDLPRAD